MGVGALIAQAGLSVIQPWRCEDVTTTSEKIRRQGEALAAIGAAMEGLTLLEQRDVLGLALNAVTADLDAPKRLKEAAPGPKKEPAQGRSKCSPNGDAARSAAEVVAKHGTCTTREVATELGLSVSAATHRLSAAAEGGLVLNEGVGIWRAAA